MARQRSPNRDKAFEIYKEHKGNITNREIANILNEDEKKIAVWKQRDKWDNNSNVVQQKNKCCTTNKSAQKTTKKKVKKEVIADEVKEVLENTELTDKQGLFCIHYIDGFNATKAYQKVYQCDYNTAKTNGNRMLTNANIKKEIIRLKNLISEELLIEIKDLFKESKDIAFSDINDFLEIKVSGKDYKYNDVLVKASNEINGRLVSEVKQNKYGTSIKLYDKSKSIEFLYKLLKDKPRAELELAILNQELENKKLANRKLSAEISKINGQDGDEVQNDGFIQALEGTAAEDWSDENEEA